MLQEIWSLSLRQAKKGKLGKLLWTMSTQSLWYVILQIMLIFGLCFSSLEICCYAICNVSANMENISYQIYRDHKHTQKRHVYISCFHWILLCRILSISASWLQSGSVCNKFGKLFLKYSEITVLYICQIRTEINCSRNNCRSILDFINNLQDTFFMSTGISFPL